MILCHFYIQCKDGDNVKIRVGGNVYYDIFEQNCNEISSDGEAENKNDILLIAGGVGINPLHSMFLNNKEALDSKQKLNLGKTMLMYSAATKDELIFKVFKGLAVLKNFCVFFFFFCSSCYDGDFILVMELY